VGGAAPRARLAGAMPYYALKDPTGEESYDLFLLYKARKYKSFFIGTFYLPRRGRLTPVFKVPWEVGDDVFEVVPSSEVEDAYRMLCVSCGRCCALNSGAFAFEDEIAPVLEKLGQRDLPSREVSVHRVGTVKLYELAVGPGGSCAFYTPEGCKIELKLSWRSKPIICLVHHCSLFAERRGEPYVKVGVKRVGGKPVPVYRRVTRSELESIAERERAKVREIYRRLARGRGRGSPLKAARGGVSGSER